MTATLLLSEDVGCFPVLRRGGLPQYDSNLTPLGKCEMLPHHRRGSPFKHAATPHKLRSVDDAPALFCHADEGSVSHAKCGQRLKRNVAPPGKREMLRPS